MAENQTDQLWFAKSALLKIMSPFSTRMRRSSSQLPLTASIGTGAIVSHSTLRNFNPTATQEPLASVGDQVDMQEALPLERRSRYALLEKMAKTPMIHDALTIHLAHALSVDTKSRRCFNLAPVDAADKETLARCEELMADLGDMLSDGLPSWCMTMMIYGVSYVRPQAEHGKGVVSIENNYYTLPHFVQEFYQGGMLAGFAGDFILDERGQRVLSDPWILVPLRVPFWTPNHKLRPVTWSNKEYSLLSPRHSQSLVETQNYGTSFLESSYQPWFNLNQAINSLLANRFNTGKQDRLIAVNTDTLDPVNAARYTREITQSLKRSTDSIQRNASMMNALPTVINHVLPVMGNGKGGITVDTQQVSADINGIEDIMLWVRQLASTLGVDYTMLGWADQMSGGLGEGGFIQTAIQSALRAEWIRKAAQEAIYRIIDIHLAYKYGKVYPASLRPYRIEFNSLNTAIQEQENRDSDSRINYISLVVTVLDAIQDNYKLANSKTMMSYLFGSVLKVDQKTIDAMISEFESAKPPADGSGHGGGFGGGSGFMESAPEDMDWLKDLDIDNMTDQEKLNLIKMAFSQEAE